MFGHTINNGSKSKLAFPDCWGANDSWKRLWERLPEHEGGNARIKCYLAWRELQRRLEADADVDLLLEKSVLSEAERWKMLLQQILDVVMFLGERWLAFRGDSEKIGDTHHLLEKSILSEAERWKMLLQQILDVVMFLGERWLAFRGDSVKIGDTHNDNFLGILELLARYYPLLQEHVGKVKSAQENETRLQANYLSPESQNEFINICAAQVRNHILEERRAQSTL